MKYFGLILMLIGLSLYAQTPLKHKAKVYVSPEGRFYIQRALPIYLRLATTPDEDAESFLLKSEETVKYSNPMYLDSEGYNTFRAPSAVDTSTKQPAYPLHDIVFEVYADSRSPKTMINYGDVKVYKSVGKVFVNGEAVISLKANDALSGVENIYYSIDENSYKVFSDSLRLNAEKEYVIKYYSVDNVGNAEEPHVKVLVIDKAKPITKLNIENDRFENIVSGRSKLILEASDEGIGVSKIYYQIDKGNRKLYKYPLLAKYLRQGNHTLTYYAVDHVNNTEKENSIEFYVDKTPPTIIEEVEGKTFMLEGKEFTSGRSKLKITSFDNKAGVKEVYYSVNGGDYQLYTKPFFLKMRAGNLSIKAYAVDNVNNRADKNESVSKVKMPYVDLSGPKLSSYLKGPKFTGRDTLFINHKTKISLRGSDGEAGIKKIDYMIDNGPLKEFGDPVSVNDEGFHSIQFTGYDNVDNSNNKELEFIVDKTGPKIFSRFSIPKVGLKTTQTKSLNVYPVNVILFLSATDHSSGLKRIYYRVNGSKEQLYSSMINNLKSGRDYKIDIRATDVLGNESIEIIEFSVE